MPSCQYCNRTIGNEGALAQHERACEANPNTPTDLAPREGASPALAGGDHPVDSLLRVIDDDLPVTERTRGARGIIGYVFDGVDRYNAYRERKMEIQDARARNVDLEPAVDYPICSTCDYRFDGNDIGVSDDHVRCPNCHALYAIRDAEKPIDA